MGSRLRHGDLEQLVSSHSVLWLSRIRRGLPATVAARLRFDTLHNPEDSRSQFLLGGNTGLRGFGLRQFSMHPAYLLAVKQVVLQTGVSDLVGTTQKILRSHVSDRIENLLQRMNV